MRILRTVALVSCATLAAGTNLLAQSAFAQLDGQLHANDRVRILVAGNRIEGKLVRLTEDELWMTIKGSQSSFQCLEIERVEKRGDPVWTGAAIGAAIAVVPAWNGCQNEGRNRPCVALGLGTFAAVGALLDYANVHNRTVYVASPGSCAVRPKPPG